MTLAAAGCALLLAACPGRAPARVDGRIADVGGKIAETFAAVRSAPVPPPAVAEPEGESCCDFNWVNPCIGGRMVGAPVMSAREIRNVLGGLARRVAEAVDRRDMRALARFVHPTRGLLIQHRFRFQRAEVEALLTRMGRYDFSWYAECPEGRSPGDQICPYGFITFAGFFDHITSRLGWEGRIPTPIASTSSVGYGQMPMSGINCLLCFPEWRMAQQYPGQPYVVFQRLLAYVDGCYWSDNQAVILLFGQWKDKWWLTGLFHTFFDG